MIWVFAVLFVCTLIAGVLRFFKMSGQWIALIVLGFAMPIFIIPLSMFLALIEIGKSGKPGVSLFVTSLNNGLWIAGVWISLAVVAAVIVMRRNKEK